MTYERNVIVIGYFRLRIKKNIGDIRNEMFTNTTINYVRIRTDIL